MPRHWLTSRRVRDHARLSALFVVSRVLLCWAGLRMHVDLGWMFLADPVDLRERLLETVYYFHAYPPGSNLVTGLLLKLAPEHFAALAQGLFWFAGLVLVNALYYLLRSVVSRRPALLASLAFSLLPQALFFENLYLYTELVASLLCLACACFHHASRRGTWAGFLGLFFVCASIGWLRSSFHLIWFVAVVALALLQNPLARRRIALSAVGPGVLLSALYLKNWAVIGSFASSSSLGGNLSQVTVARMPKEERAEWQRQGKLSPYASISVFAGPERYSGFFRESRRPGMPDSVNRLDRPSLSRPNYNHWWLDEVNRARRADAFTYLREHPARYLENVTENLTALFSPSTRWHPVKGDGNPHLDHGRVLGGYVTLYDGLVHEAFLAPVGVYAFWPALFGLSLWKAAKWTRTGRRRPGGRVAARAATLWFVAFQVVYVIAVSCLVTYGEMARYRFAVEPLLWFLGAAGLVSLGRPRNWPRRFRAWRSARRAEALPERAREREALQSHG